MPVSRRARYVRELDLFAGPGGWDVAAHYLGLSPLGIEWDQSACLTRLAAGLPTLRADVRTLNPLDFLAVWLLIASPPCQSFSAAGKRAGMGELQHLVAHVKEVMANGEWHEPIHPWEDERTGLVLQPLRFIAAWFAAGRPVKRIALEQVPGVLPVWEAYAECLREWGYSVAVGTITSEQYGVAQTRKRAVLLAALDKKVELPAPTHERYKKGTPRGITPGLRPWVSMAEALGWGMTARPYPVIASGRHTGGPDAEKVGGSQARGIIYGEREAGRWEVLTRGELGDSGNRFDNFPVDVPSRVITAKTYSWQVREIEQNRLRGAGMVERHGDRTGRTLDEPSFSVLTPGKGGGGGSKLHWVVQTGNNSMVTGRTTEDVQRYERDCDAPAPTLDTMVGTKWHLLTRQVGATARPSDEPAPTILAAGAAKGVQVWTDREGAYEPGALDRVVLRNNTSEKAGVRELDEPAPTMYFGARLNSAHWHLRMDRQPRTTQRNLDEPAPTLKTGHASNEIAWHPGDSVPVDDRPEVYLRHSKQAKATHRGLDEPAGTVAFGNDMASAAWVRERPATTIACDPRVQPPGHKVNAEDLAAGRTHYDGRAGKNAIRLSEVEAAVLQSFPAAYPWRGTRTKQFEQIGNAVPPMMAYKLLESLCVSLVRRRVKPVRKRRRVVHG